MKIALCLSGQRREYLKAYPSIKKFILDPYSPDIYIFSWIKSPELEYGIYNSFRYPDDGSLDSYIQLYKPKDVRLEYYDKTKDDFFIKKASDYGNDKEFGKRYVAMLYGISESFFLVQNKYDYVIRLRPDANLVDFQLPTSTNLSICHYGNGSNPNAPGDVMAIGKQDEMTLYSQLYDLLHYYAAEGVIPHPEITLEHHLKTQNLKYEINNFVDQILRPNSWNPHNPSKSKFV